MNKTEFFNEIMAEVMNQLPEAERDGLELELHEVVKMNDQVLHGLSIIKDKDAPAPTMYLDEAYEAFQSGVELESIAGDIAEAYLNNRDIDVSPPESMLDQNNIMQNLTIRVMHQNHNHRFLENIPYLSLGHGYVAVCDISMDDGSQGAWRTTVTKDMLSSMDLNRMELFDKAMANAANIDPPIFTDMESKVFDTPEENLLLREEPLHEDEKTHVFILTSRMSTLGASAMFYPGIQEQISRVLDEGYYLIPSSIHEFIVIPESSEQNAKALQEMLDTANSSVVDFKDVLGDKVLRYDKDSKRLEVPRELREQEKADKEER